MDVQVVEDEAQMEKALRMTFYTNRPPHPSVLHGDRGIR